MHDVKNPEAFVKNLVGMKVTSDLLLNFDMLSLFTRVPLKDTLDIFKLLLTPEVVRLFEFCFNIFFC